MPIAVNTSHFQDKNHTPISAKMVALLWVLVLSYLCLGNIRAQAPATSPSSLSTVTTPPATAISPPPIMPIMPPPPLTTTPNSSPSVPPIFPPPPLAPPPAPTSPAPAPSTESPAQSPILVPTVPSPAPAPTKHKRKRKHKHKKHHAPAPAPTSPSPPAPPTVINTGLTTIAPSPTLDMNGGIELQQQHGCRYRMWSSIGVAFAILFLV